jgi:hypothetical protein
MAIAKAERANGLPAWLAPRLEGHAEAERANAGGMPRPKVLLDAAMGGYQRRTEH